MTRTFSRLTEENVVVLPDLRFESLSVADSAGTAVSVPACFYTGPVDIHVSRNLQGESHGLWFSLSQARSLAQLSLCLLALKSRVMVSLCKQEFICCW